MEDKICHIFHHGLTIYIKKYLPYPEGDRKRLTNHFFKKKSKIQTLRVQRLSFNWLKMVILTYYKFSSEMFL